MGKKKKGSEKKFRFVRDKPIYVLLDGSRWTFVAGGLDDVKKRAVEERERHPRRFVAVAKLIGHTERMG